jgi:hypothetical protein
VATYVDPGGFLAGYKSLPAAERSLDLLLDEPTADFYWPSEYVTGAGPALFRCGLVLHIAGSADAAVVEAYETVPAVWVGEHWAFSRHSVGFGRYHDVRFVEPTVKERVAALDLVTRLLEQ